MKKETEGKMITNIKINQFNNIPLCRTTSNNIEMDVPVKVSSKLHKTGDIIIGDIEKKSVVISNGIFFVKLLVEMIFKIINEKMLVIGY